MTTEAQVEVMQGLSRTWRLVIVVGVIWFVGCAIFNSNLYLKALSVKRPDAPAPAQSYVDELASATNLNELSCLEEQKKYLPFTFHQPIEIELEIMRKVDSGMSEAEARKQVDLEFPAKKREYEEGLAKMCSHKAKSLAENMIDTRKFEEWNALQMENALIDELHERVLNRIGITLLGLIVIFLIPIGIGYGKQVYAWVMAGKN